MSNNASGSGGRSSRGESVVSDVGPGRGYCGYCRSVGSTSISHGLWPLSLTVDHYQGLLDRGWRRSGCYLYKPEMERTCCPSYTIRLRASDFIPSKEQTRVSKRMERFLDGTLDVKRNDGFIDESNISKLSCSCASNEIASSEATESLTAEGGVTNKAEQLMNDLSKQIDDAAYTLLGSGVLPSNIQLPKASIVKVTSSKRKLFVEGSEDLVFSSNISFQLAAVLRRAKQDVPYLNLSTDNVTNKKLATSLNHSAENSGLSVRACNGHINFYSSEKHVWSDEEVEKVHKRAATGSGIKENHAGKVSECPQGTRRRLEIHLKISSFDPEEFALYKRYQIKVHNETPDQVTESSYRQFLVDTPLVYVPATGNDMVPPCGFGSFHQQYVIDGQLVAVGVIDILPKCLSSKYLFWDPDFAFLSLGKYSALQEIEWIKENQLHCPSLEYYYLGYYIHSCPKMRYKAAYRPSELLCPLRYQWVPFDIARPLLDQKPYVVLSDFATSASRESAAPNVLENSIPQHVDPGQEDTNDIPFHEDEDMDELEFEDSDDESSFEPSCLTTVGVEDGSLSNILIGWEGSRLRYEDLHHAFHPTERGKLETQLRRYMRAVGAELSEQMVLYD
ncbi:Arginyltransferase [Bertholletia excelsa]